MEASSFIIQDGILKGEKRIFEIGDANLGEKILQTLKSKPDFVGQVDAITGEECTYGKMVDKSIRCSLWLRKEGIKPGDTVCLFTHNHLSTYIPCLATFYNRAILSPLFSGQTVENIKYILDLIQPKFVFADEREAVLVDKISIEENLDIKIVVFTEMPAFQSLQNILLQQELDQVSNFVCTKPKSSEDDCLLVYTSGSSGEPKPTLHSYKSVTESLMIAIEIKKNRNNVTINYSPIAWICGITHMLIDLATFVKKIIVHEKGYNPDEVLGLIEKYKVTNLFLGLGMIYQLYVHDKVKNYDTSSIKSLTLGGTKLKPGIINFLKQIVPNGNIQLAYGSTELKMVSLISKANNTNFETCGTIFPNVQLKVIDPKTGRNLGPNKKGELCFKSPYMMKGYYKNPEATKKSIDEEGWYHSGDLGYFDENGDGYVIGRVSSLQSIFSVEDLILWDVERILLLDSSVVEAFSISLRNDLGELNIFAFVTIIPASETTKEELTNLLKCLTSEELQVHVQILDSMPVTYNGKVKLDVLREMSETMLQ